MTKHHSKHLWIITVVINDLTFCQLLNQVLKKEHLLFTFSFNKKFFIIIANI